MVYVDTKCPGRMSMSGKTNLGKPQPTMKNKGGSIDKATARGQGTAVVKK